MSYKITSNIEKKNILNEKDVVRFRKNIEENYFEQVRNELLEIEQYFHKGKSTKHTKIFAIDLITHKPKYGEILLTVQTAIIYKALGIDSKFIIFRGSVGEYCFSQLISDDKVMSRLLEEVETICKPLLEYWKIPFFSLENIVEQNNFLRKNSQEIVFSSDVITRRCKRTMKELLAINYNFFTLNQQLLQSLLVIFANELRDFDKKLLIGDILKSATNKESNNIYSHFNEMFSTNYRFNQTRYGKIAI